MPPVSYEIVAVPPATPVTIPDADPTVATDVLPLVHVPPLTELESVVLRPAHTMGMPAIVAGPGTTVTTVVAAHPVPSEYVISVVPADMPSTAPLVEPMVATDVFPLVQVPPEMELVRVIAEPEHTLPGPPMLPGALVTVTTAVATQPGPVM